MKLLSKLGLTIAIATCLTSLADAQISYSGGTYLQDFDIMGATGTVTPPGWFVGTGTGAAQTGTTVAVSTGSSTGANNYNYGVAGVNPITDRSLGSLASSTGGQRDTEVDFVNNTGFAITQFNISYDGEQWRNGGSTGVANTLTLQISLTGLSGSWVDLGSAFNFTSPIVGGTAGAIDGNDAANRVAGLGGIYTPMSAIPNGSIFYLRFADPDDSGTDQGLAIDNFSFIAVPEPSVYMLLGIGLLFCGQRFIRRKRA